MADEPRTIADIDAEIKKLDASNAKEAERIKLLERRKELLKEIADNILPNEIAEMEANVELAKALVGAEGDAKKVKEVNLETAKKEFEIAQKKFLQSSINNAADKKAAEEKMLAKKKEYDDLVQANKLEQERNEIVKKRIDLLKSAGSIIYDQTVGRALNQLSAFFQEALQAQQDMAKYGKPDLFNPTSWEILNDQNTEFGLGIKEMTQSFISLDKNFASFQNLNKQTQTELAATAGKMNNLGISTDDWGKQLNNFSRGLNMGATAANNELKKITVEATRAGISPQKAIADLGTAFTQLAANGSKAGKIFVELQKQSKELGVEVGSMLNIVGKGFDTFEGAADKAGKLNGILGGDYLNSVEMLNATEEERVKLMRDAFQQSGKNFDELDRFTKKNIAATLGFKDEAEARSMLGNVSAEQKLRLQSEQQAQEQLEKAQKNSVETSRMMQMAFYDLMAVMKPLAVEFQNLIKWFAEHKHGVMVITGLVGAATVVYKLFAAAAEISRIKLLLWGTTSKEVAVQTKALDAANKTAGSGFGNSARGIANGIKIIGRAAMQSAVGLGILSGVILAIGASIAIAAYGLSFLVQSFAKFENGWVAAAAIGAVGVAVIGMGVALAMAVPAILSAGTASTVVAPGLATLALTILGVGAAVAIASVGIGYMVGKFADLFKSVNKDNIGIFKEVAIGILAIAAAIGALTLLGPFGIIGIGVLATTMIGLKKAIDEIPETKSFKAKVDILKDVGDTIKLATTVKTEQIKPAKDFVDSAKNYYQAQQTSKNADQDALVQAFKKIMTPTKEGGETDSGTPVVIKIGNADVFGKMFTGKKIANGIR